MLRATIKSLLARRSRLVLSLIAIVLGIAFLASVFAFNRMINRTFQNLMSGSVADINVTPAGAYSDLPTSIKPTEQLTEENLKTIRSVSGVKDLAGGISIPGVYLLDSHDKMIGNSFSPAYAMNYHTLPAHDANKGIVIKSGRAPEHENEVAIDPDSLKKSGYKLNDQIHLSSGKTGAFTATIVGTASWGTGGTGGSTYAFFDTATMQKQFLGGQKKYLSVWIVSQPGVDKEKLVADIAVTLPAGYSAVSSTEANRFLSEKLKSALGFLTAFLLIFAIVGLVVSAFLIVNTFSIIVAQRIKELALFRALGAKKAQIGRSVVLEALILGFIGATMGMLVGLGLAFGLAAIMRTVGLDIGSEKPSLGLFPIIICYTVGLSSTLIASLIPAYRAGEIPPITALTGQADDQTKGGHSMVVTVGVWVGVLGMITFLIGLVVPMKGPRMVPIGAGALLTLVGVAMASPLLGWPLLLLLGKMFQGLFGEVGKLAALNSNRNPRRTAATASALMVGLTLVTTFSIMGASARSSVYRSVIENVNGDFFIQGANNTSFQTSVGDAIQTISGVNSVNRQSMGSMWLEDGNAQPIASGDQASLNALWNRKITSGRAPTMANEVMATDAVAKSAKLEIGKTYNVMLDSKAIMITMVGTFQDPENFAMSQLITPRSTWEQAGIPVEDTRIFVQLNKDASKKSIQKQIQDILAKLPMVTVTDLDGYAAQRSAQLNLVLNMLYMLVGIAMVIAILGIINTLVLSVLERKRETGLLRAVGLQRWQLRSMIALESVIISVLGAALGMFLGVLFGWGLVSSAGKGLKNVSIPWLELLSFLGASVVMGILAAIIPAIWATKQDVLEAISSE